MNPPSNDSENSASTLTLDSFENCIVGHPLLVSALHGVINTIKNPCGISLIPVFGPTGVGKTTLLPRVAEKAISFYQPILQKNPGALPVIRVEAPAPEAATFNWRDFYYRALKAFEEPLIDSKQRDRYNSDLLLSRRRLHAYAPELRRAFENCIYHRQTRLIIVDEAQHLGKAPEGRRLLDQMDTIKSLASATGAIFVLAGTYELLNLLELSAQLARRSAPIHFRRYHLEKPEDANAIRNVLRFFQKNLPVPCDFELASMPEFFYDGCFGCIGILKNWVDRALAAALVEKSSLKIIYFKQTAYPKPTLRRIKQEILEGENTRTDDEARDSDLGSSMYTPPTQVLSSGTISASMRRGPVGQRAPVRDKVGVL